MIWLQKNVPGLLYVIVIALIATWLGSLLPIVGGPVFGIVLGMLIGNTFGKPESTLKGILFSSKKILQWAIIVLGAGISLNQVWRTGVDSLAVMLLTLAAAFLAAYGFGRLLKVPLRLQSMIGVGTAICGGSAIAAVSPIVQAEEEEIAYSISTIFLFNIIAVLTFPALGHLMGFSDQAFGLWAGTAINDTSSVVAAGYVYSDAAGAYATIVKLTRTVMIIPICFVFAMVISMRQKREALQGDVAGGKAKVNLRKIFPWFILWFLVASLLNTLGLFPGSSVHYIGMLGKFMIVVALTAVGLGADFRKMLRTGIKPVILGLIVWFTVAVVSVLIQWSTGTI